MAIFMAVLVIPGHRLPSLIPRNQRKWVFVELISVNEKEHCQQGKGSKKIKKRKRKIRVFLRWFGTLVHEFAEVDYPPNIDHQVGEYMSLKKTIYIRFLLNSNPELGS